MTAILALPGVGWTRDHKLHGYVDQKLSWYLDGENPWSSDSWEGPVYVIGFDPKHEMRSDYQQGYEEGHEEGVLARAGVRPDSPLRGFLATPACVRRVIAHFNNFGTYDGDAATFVEFVENEHGIRYGAWESWNDATGSGFHADAYGGNQPVYVGSSALDVVGQIPENLRERLAWATDPSELAIAEVLRDRWLERPRYCLTCCGAGEHSDDRCFKSGDVDELTDTSPGVTLTLVDLARNSGEFGELVDYRVRALVSYWSEQIRGAR